MGKLAIHGGAPVRSEFLVYGAPDIGDEEIAEVVACLKSGWLSTAWSAGCSAIHAPQPRFTLRRAGDLHQRAGVVSADSRPARSPAGNSRRSTTNSRLETQR